MWQKYRLSSAPQLLPAVFSVKTWIHFTSLSSCSKVILELFHLLGPVVVILSLMLKINLLIKEEISSPRTGHLVIMCWIIDLGCSFIWFLIVFSSLLSHLNPLALGKIKLCCLKSLPTGRILLHVNDSWAEKLVKIWLYFLSLLWAYWWWSIW